MKTQNIFSNKLGVAVLAITCGLLWGSAFPAVKTGFAMLGIAKAVMWYKLIFAGYRFFFAGMLILLFAFASGQNIKIKKQDFKHLVFMALFSTTFQYIFFYIGLSQTSGINASILNSVLTFFSLLLAHFFLKDDRINLKKFIGLVLGFAGVLSVNFSLQLLTVKFNLFGDGFVILSHLMGAIGFIYLKRVVGSLSIISFTGYQIILGATFLILPSALNVGLLPFHFDVASGLLMLYLSMLTAIAFSLWNTLIKYNPVGKISIYLFLIPLFGVILSAIFLQGEMISGLTILALALVSTGIIIVTN